MPFTGHLVVSVDPVILLFTGGFQDRQDARVPALPVNLRPDVLIESISHYMHARTAQTIAERYHGIEDGVRRMVMTNAEDEDRFREAAGLDGFRSHESILALDELFRPLATPLDYDAIYVARLAPTKRFELARHVKRLRLLTNGVGVVSHGAGAQPVDDAQLAALGLHPSTSACLRALTLPQVNDEINRSACGLALSAQEGAMRSSTQYLLCGRPVVSTRSLGGRDVLYDDYTAIVVDDDEIAVRDAVERLVDERRDPVEIRWRTLSRMRHFRYEFCRRIARIRAEHGGEPVAPERIYCDLFRGFARLRARFVGAGQRVESAGDPSRFAYSPIGARVVVDAGERFAVKESNRGIALSRSGTHVATLTGTAGWILGRLCAGASVESVISEGAALGAAAAESVERDVRDALSHFLLLGVVDFEPASA